MKTIKITHGELRALLFWSINGLVNSNGGTGENKIPMIIKKYAKECGYSPNHWALPFPTIRNYEKPAYPISREMSNKVIKALKVHHPRSSMLKEYSS